MRVDGDSYEAETIRAAEARMPSAEPMVLEEVISKIQRSRTRTQ
jgi:hypothetical protein